MQSFLRHKNVLSATMLLCTVLLLAHLPVSLPAAPSGQNDRTVSLHLEKARLGAALDSIERRTPYIFLVEGVDLQQEVSVNVRNVSISTLMDRLLASTNVSWKRVGSNIILVPRQEQDSGPRTPSRITGRVVDEAGIPVPGSAIIVTGTRIGATADADGNFLLRRIPPTAKTVDISSIGFKTKTVPIEEGLVVILEMDSEALNEAVVTGMTSIDKRLFTGATDFISAADAKIDGLVDISRSLEGRSAGVVVQNVSGSFGTAPKIRVRGATSIYGSSKPLWVVDGVIIEDVTEISSDQLSSGDANTLISSAIAGLNADDIESFQILKDGSATSIYGARAMAGVIVVTTKKGSSERTNISYTGEFTSRVVPSYRNFNIMNSQDQMAVYQELQQKGWINYAKTLSAPTTGVFGKMYELVNTFDPKTGFALENTTAAMEAYLREAEYRNTDWFDGLFSAAIQQNHSLSISGGSRNAQYYISLSAMDDPGWTLQSNVVRYTANANATYHITDNLYVNIIGNASSRKQRAPGTLDRNVNALAGEVTRDFDINPYSYALNTSRTLDPDEYYRRDYAPFNIFNELENNYMDLRVSDFRINGRVGWKPVKDLELTLLAAAKSTYTGQDHYILESSNMPQAYRAMQDSYVRASNPYLYSDPDRPFALREPILSSGGIYDRTSNGMDGWDIRATVQYSKEIAHKHLLDIFGGTEFNKVDRESNWFRGWGMMYNLGEIGNYNYKMFKYGSEMAKQYYTLSHTHERREAFFGTASYAYRNRYSINGTLRYEGSNRMGESPSARWLPTWNISGAWNLGEEPFFRPLERWISTARLRASLSLTADAPSVTNSYAIVRSTTTWRNNAEAQEAALYLTAPANNSLTYEKKREVNIGLDAGFFGNRINLVADWYTRRNYDLIGVATTIGTDGYTHQMGNVADMDSNGVEISVSTTNIDTKGFKWTTSVIYSHIHNQVTRLKTTERVMDMIQGTGFTKEGYPVRSLFSIPFAGLNDEGLPTFYDEEGNRTVSGINFQSDKLDFLTYEGSVDPTDLGSLGNIFRYKGLTLNVFITYSFGNVVRLDPRFSASYSDLSSTPREFNNRWMNPGDEALTNVPVISTAWQNYKDSELGYAYNAYNYSTERVARGDFVRMKEISLGYELPERALQRLKLAGLGLKLQATNLFLLWCDKKLNGQDPEFFNAGGVAVPMAKQFTFTVRLKI